MSSEQGLSPEKLANDIIDACATGQLEQLKLMMPQYLDKPAPTMPTPEYLLQTTAKNGRAEAIRLVLDSLPKSSQCPRHPWDPPIPAGVYFSQIPQKWEIYENSIVFAALEGSDALSVFKFFFEYGMEPDYNLERAYNTTCLRAVLRESRPGSIFPVERCKANKTLSPVRRHLSWRRGKTARA